MLLPCAPWDSSDQYTTTEVGCKWRSVLLTEVRSQAITPYQPQDALLNWWDDHLFHKYPWCPTSKKHIWEQSLKITCEEYLAAPFKWSWKMNQCLKYAVQEIQQYKECMVGFEEQKHLYYQNILSTRLLQWVDLQNWCLPVGT